MPLDHTRLTEALKARVDLNTLAAGITQAMAAATPAPPAEGPSGETLMRILVEHVVHAIADAAGPAIVEEVRQATVTVPVDPADAGLQTYINAGGAPTPTTGPTAPRTLDGTIQ